MFSSWLTVAWCILCCVPGFASEPTAGLEASVRTLSVQQRGERARVVIELQTRGAGVAGELVASVRRWDDRDERSPGLAVARATLGDDGAGVTRFVLDLDEGRDHHLRFTIETDSGPHELHHRVDLDDARAPRKRLGAIEFRVAPGVAPAVDPAAR